MANRGLSSRTLTSVTVLTLIGVVGLSACGSNPHVASGGNAAHSVAGSQAAQAAPPLAASGQADRASTGFTATGTDAKAQAGIAQPADLLTGEALIKTGSIALRSDHIAQVLDRVYGIVGGVGGDVAREDTATNEKGEVVRTTLVLSVPVERFDGTLNDLSRLGTLVDRVRNSRDVTTAVADVTSRVRSAQRSISTLRRLFGRASKLGDIIRLESELSQREANLESLEAQQRALNDRTTMSTITMTVDLPRASVQPTSPAHHATGGFVSGIRQGWHALTRTMLAVGHGLGVVLPLGTVVLLLAGLGLWFVRRFAPAPARVAKTTVEP
jgi:hypothetical protein